MYLSIYLQGSKGLCGVLLWEGTGDRTELKYFEPHSYGRQCCVFLVLLMLNRRPSGPALCWVMAFFTASHQHLLRSQQNTPALWVLADSWCISDFCGFLCPTQGTMTPAPFLYLLLHLYEPWETHKWTWKILPDYMFPGHLKKCDNKNEVF